MFYPRRLSRSNPLACVLAVHVIALTAVARAVGDSPGVATDMGLFPKAYGMLDNEHLLFPMEMGRWPVKIDGSRQLFVDDYLIAQCDKLTRQIHQAKKHPANPLLAPDKPWEQNLTDGGAKGRAGCVFHQVRRDEKTGKFQMWYAGYMVYVMADGSRARFPGCYAESDDGIHWRKPELGLFEFEGSKANNIIIPYGNLWGVFVDEKPRDAAERYLGLVWHEHLRGEEGYYRYASPDGIRWKRLSDEPVAYSSKRYTMPCDGIGDTTLFRWDPKLGCYVGDVKFILPGPFRCRGIMTSDDLIHWTRPRMTIYPDAKDHPDTQIYGHASFPYESMWLGLMRVYHEKLTDSYKQTPIELTASRDGSHFTRVGDRSQVIPLGGPNDWDGDYHAAAPPIPMGGELWIYYRSAKMEEEKAGAQFHRIGLATLRRDGFVSLNAGEKAGTVTTRPLSYAGSRLFVNAEAAPGGRIRVAVLDRDGKPLPGRSLDDAQPITAGSLRVPVRWNNGDSIALDAGRHARLRFQLTQAKLYSFWVE